MEKHKGCRQTTTKCVLPCKLLLCFPVFHRCCLFYKVKAKSSTSKKIATCFIPIFLHYRGTKPAISRRYAINYTSVIS